MVTGALKHNRQEVSTLEIKSSPLSSTSSCHGPTLSSSKSKELNGATNNGSQRTTKMMIETFTRINENSTN
jgi:hypothetical protein